MADEVTVHILQDVANNLLRSGAFSEANYQYRTQGAALTVEFRVKDAEPFLPCSFENFLWFSDEELITILCSRVELFDGQAPSAGGMLEKIAAVLENLLHERGIEGRVRYSPYGRLGGAVQSIQFKVEDVRVLVRHIEFMGVEQVDASLLQKAGQPLLGKDFERTFIRSFAQETVGSVYRQRGYLRADFGDPVAQLLEGDRSTFYVAVTFPVSEGPVYRLKDIWWAGESVIPLSDPRKMIHLVPGEPVDAVQLEQDLYRLPALYEAKGYLHAQVKPTLFLEEATLTATYELHILQGEQYRMGKLEIAGLDPSSAERLRKLCRLREGDVYDKSYWARFMDECKRHLPAQRGAWRAVLNLSIREDLRTVDVTIIFSPGASP